MRTPLVMLGLVTLLSQSAPAPALIKVDVTLEFNGNRFGVLVSRPFGLVGIRCAAAAGQKLTSIATVLGPSVKTLTVRAYHPVRFPSERQLTDYIRAMLVARPENGVLGTDVWSEGGDLDISMVTEWNDGRFGRFDLGSNGPNRYVHLEDQRGCEWWSRFPKPSISQGK